MTATTGAVAESKKARAQQNELALDAANDDLIKLSKDDAGEATVTRIGAKTFYLTSGFWVDSAYDESKGLKETELRFGSNEFFELINKEREIGQFFAVGKKLVLVWKGKVYRFTS